MLLYWLWASKNIPKANEAAVAKEDAAVAPALP
jgi:hypothetical protein